MPQVKRVIAEKLQVQMDDINYDSHFIADLGADSIDIVEIGLLIEEEFCIDMPIEVIQSINTLGDAMSVLSRDFGLMIKNETEITGEIDRNTIFREGGAMLRHYSITRTSILSLSFTLAFSIGAYTFVQHQKTNVVVLLIVMELLLMISAISASLKISSESGKEPLDRVEPRGRGRREVEGPARVPREPCSDLGVL